MTDRLFEFSRTEVVEAQGSVSFVAFDSKQELIWVGGQKGSVTSYYSCGLQPYTKFYANSEVRELHPIDAGILSLSSNRLNLHSRGGVPQHSFTSPNLAGMCCMSKDPTGTELYLGGHTNIVTKYDLGKQAIATEIDLAGSECVLIRETQSLVCLGCPDGDILLYDKNSYKRNNTIQAHSGTISDFDICDNLLVSCGFASRGNELSVTRALLVYDLRMMRSLTAVHCSIDPLQLRFMPMYHSQVLIASQPGQFQQVEVASSMPQSTKYFEVDLGGYSCYDFDLSSSSKALAIGDTAGMVHLLASHESTSFNQYSQPTYFPSEQILNFPKVNIDDYSFPLSTVPIPHTSEPLLSDWPSEFNRPGGRRVKPIDADLLRSMKMVKYMGGYSPNPNNLYKNTIPYELKLQPRIDDPRGKDNGFSKIPRVYQCVDVDISTLTENELHNINRTKFSVLCNTKGNGYICSVLQLLYYIEPIALALKSHICKNTVCMACSLGLLFYTLDVTDDKVTMADTFIQAFDKVHEANYQNWKLHDKRLEKRDFLQLAQSFLTTLLRQLHTEVLAAIQPPQHNSPVCSAFGSKVAHKTTCSSCTQVLTNKSSINLFYNLEYRTSPDPIPFVQLLKEVMQPEKGSTQWCNRCRQFTSCKESGTLESLPYILQLNCGSHPTNTEFWQQQCKMHTEHSKRCPLGGSCSVPDCTLVHGYESNAWLPLNFHITSGPKPGELKFGRGLYDKKEGSQPYMGIFEYELCSVIAHIDSGNSQGLMLHSLVDRKYHQLRGGSEDTEWYLFNGCSATSTHNKEATNFGQPWKTACVVVYKQVKLPKDLLATSTISPLELFTNFNVRQMDMNIMPLTANESLSKGELVGIGLCMDQGPSFLLRVVMVRGQGTNEGVPFTHSICPTQYGTEGHQSTKLLYFQIKCLVDRGVILVGHNIAKQLKFVNIQLPSQQCIDTIDLFKSPLGATHSLQYLCPTLLTTDFVAGPQHAAQASLQLYEKFLELKRAGQFEKTLKSLHDGSGGAGSV